MPQSAFQEVFISATLSSLFRNALFKQMENNFLFVQDTGTLSLSSELHRVADSLYVIISYHIPTNSKRGKGYWIGIFPKELKYTPFVHKSLYRFKNIDPSVDYNGR